MHARTRPTLYEQLETLPEGVTGEILDGQLYAHPRPSGPHGFAASSLGYDLIGPFQRGRGGPGGWWIIDEPQPSIDDRNFLSVWASGPPVPDPDHSIAFEQATREDAEAMMDICPEDSIAACRHDRCRSKPDREHHACPISQRRRDPLRCPH